MRFSTSRQHFVLLGSRLLRGTTYLFLLLPVSIFAALYQGQNVDGHRYGAFARSLETGKYYPVSVTFDHSRANILFDSGKKLDLILDEESVEDPEEVLATDPQGHWWALSIDGLDEPRAGRHNLAVAQTGELQCLSSCRIFSSPMEPSWRRGRWST
jgi:hypothetical protein